MVGSRHGKAGDGAQRRFTDREEPISLFEAALSEPQTWEEGDLSAYRALAWYGVGGQGKTELRKELTRRIEAKRTAGMKIALGVVDFETSEHRSPLGAMLKLRAQMGRGRQVIFPTFDFAFSSWFAAARPGADIRAAYPELFGKGESELVDDLAEWAGEATVALAEIGAAMLPGAGILYKYQHRLRGRLRVWFDQRSVKAKIAEISEHSEAELLEKLPVYLGFDLWRAAQESDAPRLVIFLDTYEALWRDATRQSSLMTDDWVRDMIEAAPGTLVALFGRDRLRWSEIDTDWERIVDQHLLGGLSTEDADRFLRGAGVPTKDLRTRIVEVAQGLPFHLDLALDLYEGLVTKLGMVPDPEAFGRTPAEVLDRFLRHLSDTEENDLRLASYGEDLTEPLFLDLVAAFPALAGGGDWARLSRRSFMSPGEHGRLEMHALMREALQESEARERHETWTRIHLWLFERADLGAQPEDPKSITLHHEKAFQAAMRHLRVADPGQTVAWLKKRIGPFRAAGRWRVLDEVLTPEVATSTNSDLAWVLRNLSSAKRGMARYPEAERLCEQVLEMIEASVGNRHPDYADELIALAVVRQEAGRIKEVEELYRRGLEIQTSFYEQNDHRVALTLHKIAANQYELGHDAEADQLLLQARDIYMQTDGEKSITYAAALNDHASIRLRRGHEREAEELFRRAHEIQAELLGDCHEDLATTLNNLAYVAGRAGRSDEEESLYLRSLEIKEALFGDKHPKYAITLHNLAHVHWKKGERNISRETMARVLAIYETALGDMHPEYAGTLQDLAFMEDQSANYEEAETLYERALAIKEAAFGTQHVSFAQTLHNLSALYRRAGKPSKAEATSDRAFSILIDNYGYSHPHVARMQIVRSLIFRDLDRLPEAKESAERAVLGLTEALGDDHPWTVEARENRDRIEAGESPEG